MSAETILVVDCHPEVLSFSTTALARCSYDVLTASSGERALDILESQRHIDLVVSEVLMMSAMSGPALAGRIRESYPSTGVLLMTGYTDEQINVSVPLLEKPFTAATLIHRVEQVLSESRRVVEALQTTLETNRTLKREIQSSTLESRQTIRKSRQSRSERFCRRLGEVGAVIPTVLVAEDNELFRYAVCRFLSGIGFAVLEASDGQEALDVTRAYRGRIDVLVTDVCMPRLNGLDLAKTLGTERPQTSIIFATAEDIGPPGTTLRKPFELDDLLAVIVGTLLTANGPFNH